MGINLNVTGGGIFSKVMRLIQHIVEKQLNFDEIYLDVICKTSEISENIIDSCINQEKKIDSENIKCTNIFTYNKKDRIEKSDKIADYKVICNKITFTKELNDLIKFYTDKFSFDSNSIGVHIRLCDMNISHKKDYGYFDFDDYLNELNKIVTKESKIFVASDNYESIEKLIKIYGNQINFVPNMLRVNKEEDNSYEFQIENLSNPNFWIESFLDMILLSKCSTLICRTSNFSNASVCFSNTIEDVIRL